MAAEIKQLLANVSESEPLAKHCTYKIGGKARYFISVKNEEELLGAIKAAQGVGLVFYLIGQGSNILFPDEGLGGLVIKCEGVKIDLASKEGDFEELEIWAGTPLAYVVKLFQERSLTGLEWASGIPGTVGGAVFGNAGSYVTEMQDRVESVKVFDINSAELKILSKQECAFAYRESIFKKEKNLIIISVRLRAAKGEAEKIAKSVDKYLADRMAKHQYDFPTAGSVFKNPPGNFAGALIEQCGLKGRAIGGAVIWDRHANFIINKDAASAKDVLALGELAKSEVKKKFGIELEYENIIF
ncbi:MAG: UDP-N-acetylmuramate dehydrogenase [Candidatus Paceibacterota bacterium]